MSAGQGIIADEGDPPARQHMPDQRHGRLAHLRGNPGVDAVGDDIVERPRRIALPGIEDILDNQGNIAKTRCRYGLLPAPDRHR